MKFKIGDRVQSDMFGEGIIDNEYAGDSLCPFTGLHVFRVWWIGWNRCRDEHEKSVRHLEPTDLMCRP